jgi:hypothetical protein
VASKPHGESYLLRSCDIHTRMTILVVRGHFSRRSFICLSSIHIYVCITVPRLHYLYHAAGLVRQRHMSNTKWECKSLPCHSNNILQSSAMPNPRNFMKNWFAIEVGKVFSLRLKGLFSLRTLLHRPYQCELLLRQRWTISK